MSQVQDMRQTIINRGGLKTFGGREVPKIFRLIISRLKIPLSTQKKLFCQCLYHWGIRSTFQCIINFSSEFMENTRVQLQWGIIPQYSTCMFNKLAQHLRTNHVFL